MGRCMDRKQIEAWNEGVQFASLRLADPGSQTGARDREIIARHQGSNRALSCEITHSIEQAQPGNLEMEESAQENEESICTQASKQ
eukprot:768281-Hanusia_phi.AAC.4